MLLFVTSLLIQSYKCLSAHGLINDNHFESMHARQPDFFVGAIDFFLKSFAAIIYKIGYIAGRNCCIEAVDSG